MPLALIIIAVMLIASGIRGTYRDLGNLIVGDFTGQGNFFTWLIAIGCVGCLGYITQFQKFSRVFLALILVAMFVKQGTGLFPQFVQALQGSQAGSKVTPPGQRVTTDAAPTADTGLTGAQGGIGSKIGDALGTSLIGKAIKGSSADGGVLPSIGKAFGTTDFGSFFNAVP